MIKAAIIGYTFMLALIYGCEGCMMDSRFWQPYYIWEQTFGGGLVLWWIGYRYSQKYRVPAFLTFCFSCVRCGWNIVCYWADINPSATYWTLILFFCLLPVIYWTLFVPNGRLTNWLMRTLNLKDDRLYEWQERIVRE